jgi:hypothetical protein
MQVAVDQSNQAQGSIRYPNHNGWPEIEPVFVIFKYDNVTTTVRDDLFKEDALTRNNRQERQQRREYERRGKSHRSCVETSPQQMERSISWRAYPVIIRSLTDLNYPKKKTNSPVSPIKDKVFASSSKHFPLKES